MRLLRSAIRLAAAAALAAAEGRLLPAGPAAAATCEGPTGVSVVVDFHQLGGGVQTACVAGGGQTAAGLFAGAGFALTYVQRQAGFVCRINGKPASDPCVHTPPTDAYWGLWWSDGKSGQWTYATRGADAQSVPEGGYVGFSWNGSSTRSAPGLAPAAHPTQAASPTRTPSSRPKPTKPTQTSRPVRTPKPSRAGTSAPSVSAPSASASATSAPSATASASASATGAKPSKPPKRTRSAPPATGSTAPTPTPSDAAPASSSDPAESAEEGLPAWVGPALVAALFAAGAGVAVARRRRNPS